MQALVPRKAAWSSRDIRLIASITQKAAYPGSATCQRQPIWRYYKGPAEIWSRGAKTRATRKLKDLQQGALSAEPLPDIEADDALQYPAVIQGARNNMIKFNNCVVLTRVGNFYELFFEHAEQYASLLNLKLGSKKTSAGPVAWAGFPFFQLERYLKILVQDLNKFVAISEEFPTTTTGKVKSGGLLFDRRIARVITPGTLIDEKFVDPYENNFLLSIHLEKSDLATRASAEQSEYLSAVSNSSVGLAWLDLTTGDFFTQQTSAPLLPASLARIGAREIILDRSLSDQQKEDIQRLVGEARHLVTFHNCTSEYVTMSSWEPMLESPVRPETEAAFSAEEKVAAHCLLDYVRDRLQGLEMKLLPPIRKRLDESLSIDRNSLRGLEILETARDGLGKGSLLHSIRRTTTKSGARLLRDRLTSPSASLSEINRRLDVVTVFLQDPELREETVNLLRHCYDVQRLVQKFSLNKGDADDMVCLAKAINACQSIHEILTHRVGCENTFVDGEPFLDSESLSLANLLGRIDLNGPAELSERISHAIDEEGLNQKHRREEEEDAQVVALAQEVVMTMALPDEIETMPKKIRSPPRANPAKDPDFELEEPWIMCETASETLTKLHNDLNSLRVEKTEMAESLRHRLKAATLTLKWTPGLGHICHVKGASAVALDNVQGRLVHSTKSTRSFYVTEWSRLGSRFDQAKIRIRSEEQRIFSDLRNQVIMNLVKLRRNAAVIDELDVACSFAVLAEEQGLVRPIINASTTHKIVGGRHATVTLGLEEQGRSFVRNDLFLNDQQRVWLVTGPNMGGKSTFLRQNALITILAQVGSYVPTEHAEIGIVDQIFSRIGAADDLFRDQSTFMVEMLETAAILKHATPRSFVIMDEVGRGTTPEDGTAVAFACLHHLHHVNKCRTLFATHFHALADMTWDFGHLARYCTDVLDDKSGSFSFVHRIRPGVNRQSHALKVARLAGLPEPAINVARDVLQQLLNARSNVQLEQTDSAAPFLAATAG